MDENELNQEKRKHLVLIANEMFENMEQSIDEYYFATECNSKITRHEVYEEFTKRIINGD